MTYDFRTASNPARWNGKCKKCGKFHTALLRKSSNVRTPSGWFPGYTSDTGETLTGEGTDSLGPAVTCVCGNRVRLNPVKGRLNPNVACTAKCVNSLGFNCECSCGGKNHGSGGINH